MIGLLAVVGLVFLLWYLGRGLTRFGSFLEKIGDAAMLAASRPAKPERPSRKRKEPKDEWEQKIQDEIEEMTE